MGTIFYFVLNMSIAATIIGVILIILRGFKVPSNIMYGLWSIVFIRLVFPFALPSTLSALNLLRPIIKKVVEVPTMGQFRFMSFSNYISPQRSYFPFVFSKACQEKLFNTFAYVWICGVCLLLLILFIMLFITNRELSKAYKLRDNIFVSKFVDTPVVFGIIKPKILIPTGIDSNFYGLEYIIQHENVHIKRSDNLWRMLGLMVASIHWFNPFVWFALRLFIADMEFSCDRRVVKLSLIHI